MGIDKVTNIGGVPQPDNSKASRSKITSSDFGKDSVSISPEAQKAQEVERENKQVRETVKKAVEEIPDIRQDRVKEVKVKLSQGYYDNLDSKMLDRVAEKIAEALIRS